MAAAPRSLPKKWHNYWRHPWYKRARESKGFKAWLLEHGYLSPHFRISEAGGQDRNPLGTPLPRSLYANAQRQAFRLERLRHRLGDRPIQILSWYRNSRHNADVGGASRSRHMQGDATDFTRAFVDSVGAARFDRLCEWLYEHDGFGTYPSGSRHTDTRGFRARW